MNKNLSQILFHILFILGMLSQINGQTSQSRYMAGISLELINYQNPIKPEGKYLKTFNPGISLSGQANINRFFNFSLNSFFAPSIKFPLPNGNYRDLTQIRASLTSHFKLNSILFRNESSIFAPYLIGGLGVEVNEIHTQLYYPIGIGLTFQISKNFGFDIKGIYRLDKDNGVKNYHNIAYSIGTVFALGSKPVHKQLSPEDGLELKRPITSTELPDTDNDGVLDRDDLCPDLKGSAAYLGCPDEKSINTNSETNTTKINTGALENLPEFAPWPPPYPSAVTSIPRDFFLGASNLFDIKEILVNALDLSGYHEKSFYKIPNTIGFTIITRIEQIYEDGRPKPDPLRWSSKLEIGNEDDSFLDKIIAALTKCNSGYFRVVLFVVAPKVIIPSNEKINSNEALSLLRKGSLELPSVYKRVPFSDNYICTALIYEFVLPEFEKEAKFLDPSKHLGRKHLEKSGLWYGLLMQKK